MSGSGNGGGETADIPAAGSLKGKGVFCPKARRSFLHGVEHPTFQHLDLSSAWELSPWEPRPSPGSRISPRASAFSHHFSLFVSELLPVLLFSKLNFVRETPLEVLICHPESPS